MALAVPRRALLIAALVCAAAAGAVAEEVETHVLRVPAAKAKPGEEQLPDTDLKVLLRPGEGDAPPALLLHGYHGSIEDLDQLGHEFLTSAMAAVLFEAPDNNEKRPEKWVDWVDRALTVLHKAAGPGGPLEGRINLGGTVVVGHSMGAGVALHLAARDAQAMARGHTGRFRGFALANPGLDAPFFPALVLKAMRTRTPTLAIFSTHDDIVPALVFGTPIAFANRNITSRLLFGDHNTFRAAGKDGWKWVPFLGWQWLSADGQRHKAHRMVVDFLAPLAHAPPTEASPRRHRLSFRAKRTR